MSAEVKAFFGIGAFVVVIAVVYWFGSYEDAGTTMLVAAAGFSLFTGGWLWLRQRRPKHGDGDDHAAVYFPHTSLWPFWIGVAGFFLANGLIVGSWFLVPGGILLLVGVVGYAVQSRSRA